MRRQTRHSGLEKEGKSRLMERGRVMGVRDDRQGLTARRRGCDGGDYGGELVKVRD